MIEITIANTKVFNKDLNKSIKDNAAKEEIKKVFGSIEYNSKQINALLAILVAKDKKFKIGSIIIHAVTLGKTKYTIGLVFNRYKASTCSVTFIVANSAVKDEPTLPIIITDIRTGDNSRTKAIVSIEPTRLIAFKYNNSFATCKAKTMLTKKAVIKLIVNEPGPTMSICSTIPYNSISPN